MTSFFLRPPCSSITVMLNFFHSSSGTSIVVFTKLTSALLLSTFWVLLF